MQDLGTLGGGRSFGLGMSANGHIVGEADTGTGATEATLWRP